MRYQGKAIKVLGREVLFGQVLAWIQIIETGELKKVTWANLKDRSGSYNLADIYFLALAARIKEDIAQKKILAPYESSLVPLPHQILVLEKVMQSSHNRFLLADEVGMGKTIEAGLLLKELKLRGDIKRVLTIVPKSAMLQWQSEMKEHFSEIFHIYESSVISSLARTFSNIEADEELNFWEQHNQIIVSLDALKPLEKRKGWSQARIEEYNRYRMQAVIAANFDLVIIDEVHKMGGANQQVSRYILAQELCNAIPNALLLSATPHRGKSDHFRRILKLLDADAFDGEGIPSLQELEPYVIRTEKRLAIDYEGNHLFNERTTERLDVLLNEDEHAGQIALYEAVTKYVVEGFNSAKATRNRAKGLIMVLFQKLVSSSTAAILSAMQRRLQRLDAEVGDELEEYAEEEELEEELEDMDVFHGRDVQYADIEDEQSEREQLSTLIKLAKECMTREVDAKAEALKRKYEELRRFYGNKDLKVIVFTEFRATQSMLNQVLRETGYRTVIINGSQDLDQRKQALSIFKNEAQFLVATDAAGESLNMQFCHLVFNYDLPWNPMTIEQRIGRVDRIGQKNKVRAYNMLANNSIDARVHEVIENKLNNILQELGIDKTSDVLDSTFDSQEVNNLYLQSLLNPESFDTTGEKWLDEIKAKLKNFKSTEGALPEVKEEEIDYKKASDVKYSPLPIWLERLFLEYCQINSIPVEAKLGGIFSVNWNGKVSDYTFDTELALAEPGVVCLTLQSEEIKSILNDISTFDASQGILSLSTREDEKPGIWSLWEISARNNAEQKNTYRAFFIADSGQVYTGHANNIWKRLLNKEQAFSIKDRVVPQIEIYKTLEDELENSYKDLKSELDQQLKAKLDNKIKSYEFQLSKLQRIGIENIRKAKTRQLKAEQAEWLKAFEANQTIIPDIKHLLSFRIDG